MARTSPAAASRQYADPTQYWVKRFLIILLATLLLAASSILLLRKPAKEKGQEMYLPVVVEATTITGRQMAGKLFLLIDTRQENELRRWQPKLQHVTAAVLADLFSAPQQPDLRSVQEGLLAAVNDTLPQRLQIRDLLIQEFVRGWSGPLGSKLTNAS